MLKHETILYLLDSRVFGSAHLSCLDQSRRFEIMRIGDGESVQMKLIFCETGINAIEKYLFLRFRCFRFKRDSPINIDERKSFRSDLKGYALYSFPKKMDYLYFE
jgi:hypothetical protein